VRRAGIARGALVSVAVALVLLPLVAVAQKPRAERPAYSVGDAWVLTDAAYRLTRLTRDAYVFTAAGDREIWLTRDLAITYVKRGAETLEIQTPPRLSWPLEPGRRGVGRSIIRVAGADIEVYANARVEAAERVMVAGGAFDAVRIHYVFDPEIPGQFGSQSAAQRYGPAAREAAFEVTWWYAPAVQRIVKSTSSKALLTFELGGAPPAMAQAPADRPRAADPPRAEPPVAKAPGSAPAPITAAPAAPLAVSVSSPADQARVDRDTVPLAGLVTSGRGVARVVVTLNGAEVTKVEERAPRPAVSLNASLALREGANLLVIAATDTDGAIRQEVRTIHYQKATPLTIAVRHPADGARVSEPQTVVAAVVTSSRGIGSVTVTLNGTEVLRQAEATRQASVVVTAPVTLREGANTIVLTARETDGTLRQDVRTVTLDRTAAVATPAPSADRLGRDAYAVIIGVGRYEHLTIPTLKYAVADAEAMYRILTDTAGFKKDNVLLLTDRSERKPTLRNIKYALGTFLARAAQKDDTVIVYFAGHGAPEVDQRGLERDGLAKYLIPSDADPDDLFSTALPMDDLQTIFGRIEAERVVMFLDACYSGAAGGRTFASKRTRSGAVDDLFLERLTRSKGRAIITASRPAELSVELPELGHGIFTYYLTEGLRGAGDLNRDGIVSLQELYEYVEQQVVRKSRAVGGNQHPMMKGELEGVLPLIKVRGR
jgi:caspase domain-containing protein